MFRSSLPSRTILISSVIVVVSGSGCAKTVDLQAVEKFQKTTAAASASFQQIAGDYYNSCLRYRDYRAETHLGTYPLTAIPTHDPIVAMPAPETSAQPEPIVTSDPSAKKAPPKSSELLPLALGGDDRDCAVSKALSERWSLENKILIAYVQALGAVAGIGTAPSQPSFEALGAALKSAGAINSDATAKAGGDLADAIVAALIRRQQERDVVGLATDAKGSVDALTEGLESVALLYRIAVRDELAELDSNRIVLISAEISRLNQLRQQAGLSNGVAPDVELLNDFSEAAIKKLATPLHLTNDEERARILAALRLRDRISRQRATWANDSSDAVRRANMAPDYFLAVAAIRKTHDSLVKTQGGLAGVVATMQPLVDELSAPVNALIAASKPATSK